MSSQKPKNELDRREFMKRLLAGTGFITNYPGEIFLSNMMLHFLEKGYAQAAGVSDGFGDMKFINIAMDGGLPRWYWDGLIRPNGNDLIVPNPMVISKFKINGTAIDGEYATTQVGKFHMPHVWTGNIPTSNGSVIPMSALANNMMIFRGINTLIDSHALNKQRHMAPVVGGVTLSGLVADKAQSPIPAFQYGNFSNFFISEKGISSVTLDANNPLKTALTPFLPGANIIELKNPAIENAIDLALNRMAALAGDKNKSLPTSFESRRNAKALMKRQFGDLQSTYNVLYAKYLLLMNRSFEAKGNLAVDGIDNIPLIGANANRFMVTELDYYTGDAQLVTDINTKIQNMAESFAVAEFMLMQGLSSTANLIVAGFNDAYFDKTFNPTSGKTIGPRRTHIFPDAHTSGSHIGLILYSRYFRALSACLYEFIGQLKSKQTSYGNLFNQTTISITSEFNRSPLFDSTGSDHGWQGSVYSIFSGMVDELTVVGNVKLDSGTGSRYPGTWGEAGLVEELGNRDALLGNAISSIALMTEVVTPTPNDKPFIKKVNGKVLPVVGTNNVSKNEES